MANYNVDIGVSVTGQNGLKTLETKLKKITQEVKDAEQAFVDFNQRLKSFDQRRQDRKKLELDLLKSSRSRLLAEKKFNEESERGNRIARQKTAEFLRQQRLLLKMSRQYSEPIGPVASGAVEFRRDKARRQRAQFIASGAPGVPVAGAQQALPAFRERGLQILDNSVRLNESQLRIEAALNGERQRGVRFLEAQSREEKRQLDLGIAGQRSNLIPGVSSGKAVPRTQYPRPIGPQPAGAGRGAARGGSGGLSDLALGIGFPLLFGGGAGSIAGGALGSVGGMGGQVLGSAIGGIVDTFAASVGKLGQALDPLTADIDALVEASGLAGTETGKLISSLKEFVGIEKSLEIATQQLAAVVGEEGVQALKSYGKANSELSAELGLAFSSLAAAAAPLLERIAKATTNKFEEMRLYSRGVGEFKDDPIIKQAREDRRFSIDQSGFEKTVLERARELENIEKSKAEAELQSVAGGKERLEVLIQESIILENKGDLLNESVQNSKLELINIEEKLETEKLNNRAKETGMTLAQKTLEQDILAIKFGNQKLTLENQITDAQSRQFKNQDRRAKAAVRSANADAKRVQRELEARVKGIASATIKEEQSALSLAKIDLERTFLLDGELAGLEQKLKVIEIEKEVKQQILDTQYKQGQLAAKSIEEQELLFQAYLNQDQIVTLTAQTQKEQTEELIKQIGLVEQVSALSAAAGFDVLGLANNTKPFQSTGMYAPNTGPVSFEEGIDLAPLIAYQVELDRILEKYPMIGEAATAAAGLVTFGVQEMIDGTKSAEQVFADFLNSIADMLLKTAQQMIAQYIAIAIAKMFAGMGGGTSFSGFSGSMPGGNPFTPGGSMPFLLPPGKADGGPVSGGRPYTVGERGPELFVPGASGTIIPNHAMGGVNVETINITVENTGEQLNPAAQKQLAGQVQGIVLSTLANERRSGGML